MRYVDTLYGHQSEIFDLDTMHVPKIVTSGNDRSCRIWKTWTDSQLVFRAPSLTVDCCRMLNSTCFVSGSSDGLQLWNAAKKKPLSLVSFPHGQDHNQGWVQSLSTTHGADLIVSGLDDRARNGDVCGLGEWCSERLCALVGSGAGCPWTVIRGNRIGRWSPCQRYCDVATLESGRSFALRRTQSTSSSRFLVTRPFCLSGSRRPPHRDGALKEYVRSTRS